MYTTFISVGIHESDQDHYIQLLYTDDFINRRARNRARICCGCCTTSGSALLVACAGPLDDHDRAPAVLHAVVAHAPQQRPLEETVAVAAHDEHVGAVLLRGAADHLARVAPLHARLHLHAGERGADALGLGDHGVGRRGEVLVHAVHHVLRQCVPGAVDGRVERARRSGVDEHDGGRRRLAGRGGRDDVVEAPGECVHALLALVHRHHHTPRRS
uniref:Uncharacterized protein n=1 Tax=Arundo donax TaxID=35708 RepID=A0A0A9BJB2_ARUDO